MPHTADSPAPGSFKGLVYGDLVGSPYMIENTYNRYFELGESRKAYSHGRVRAFFPGVTEVSHGAAAVTRWLSVYRDAPTAESLQKCLREQYDAHPRGGWTEATRLFLTSGMTTPSATPDWAAVTRCAPIAPFFRDDLFRAMDLAEAAVKATCSDEDTARVALAYIHAIHMAQTGSIQAEIYTTMEMQYGLNLSRPEDDLRAELRGEVRQPLVMMGAEVPGAYRYVAADHPAQPSARKVTEAAIRAVVRSDSWEDAVRKAVSFGGPSNAVAGLAGALAESLYGEVTPSVVGKLFSYLPTDIARQVDSYQETSRIHVDREGSPYQGISRDCITLINSGPGESVYVVPKDRRDIRSLLKKTFPNVRILPPEEMQGYLDSFKETREGTYAYGPRPEVRTLYIQDSERIVSPSQFVAPGMPPLQERKRHLQEFLRFRAWCIDCQKELNTAAGNPGAGQVHYGNAYHLWIGSRRIDFMFGDALAGRVSLNDKGLLRIDLGDYRDLSTDARFENHREQAWASRSLFTIAESSDPLSYMEDIRADIRARLLDEGLGSGLHGELDSRYLSEDERRERTPVSNIEHLEPLSPDSGQGIQAQEKDSPLMPQKSTTKKTQGVTKVFTIGYGVRSQEGFINTLRMAGVDTVVDVRSTPQSRHVPQFDADTIYEALKNEDIGFFLAGDKLGGRPQDPKLYTEAGLVDWEAMRKSTPYQEGISAIERLAGEGHVVAVVCKEGDPLACHRFGTVARDLAGDGMDVKHILTNGEIVSHAVMEDRLLERCTAKNQVSTTMTGSYSQQVEECYRILNRERGYKKVNNRRRKLCF